MTEWLAHESFPVFVIETAGQQLLIAVPTFEALPHRGLFSLLDFADRLLEHVPEAVYATYPPALGA